MNDTRLHESPTEVMHLKAPALLLVMVLVGALAGCAGNDPDPTLAGGATAESLRRAGLSPTIRTLARRAHARAGSLINRDRIAATLKTFTARPHHAGSSGGMRTAHQLNGEFTAAGLESRIEEYHVLLPYPREIIVELLRPMAYRAAMKEEALTLDYDTHTGAALEPSLAFSPDGEVTGPLVYVHFGRAEDFARLATLGINPRGALGIVRGGRISPSSKLYNATEAGMAGLLIYSDPSEYGYHKGDIYPSGPWLPDSGVRRSSVLDLAVQPGDPLTPGSPAHESATRLAVEDARALPSIPAAPLSANDARPLLEHLGGPPAPEEWQGGLPFTYHMGGADGALGRLTVSSDWRIRKIRNVIATLRGSAFPNDWVLLGCHRDSWVHGAVDSGSGTAVMMECARVLGTLAREGLRPSRSIVFCSWDGATFGLMGSTEHVEEHREALARSAILYVNLDAAISGGTFRVRGTPALSTLFRGTLAALDESAPGGDHRLSLAPWQRLRSVAGGSDFMPFQHLLGIPVLDTGFEGPCGVIHTLYDTYGWTSKHGDPGLKNHARLVEIVTGLAWRAGTASMVPYDFSAIAEWIRGAGSALRVQYPEFDAESLQEATDDFEEAVTAFVLAREAFLESDPDPARANHFARASRQVFKRFTRDTTPPGGSFYRNLLVAPEVQTGTETVSLPFLTAALKKGDAAATEAAIKELIRALERSKILLETLAERLDEEL